jgi:formylglycine-generating enzyme
MLSTWLMALMAVGGASLAARAAPDDEPPAPQADSATPAEPQRAQFPAMKNSLGMTLAYIPAGEFMMGTIEPAETLTARFKEKPELVAPEYPLHRVRISNTFYMSACEVTVGQFSRFVEATGYKTDAERDDEGGWGCDLVTKKWARKSEYNWRNPRFAQTPEHPVVELTWNDAMAFCAWLSKCEGRKYRLPTEAEWEYACRAGAATDFWSGNGPASAAGVANVNSKATEPVGKRRANPWGLYDVHGNADEICLDYYLPDYYKQFAGSTAVDPRGPSKKQVQAWIDQEIDEALKAGKIHSAADLRVSRFQPCRVSRGGSFG